MSNQPSYPRRKRGEARVWKRGRIWWIQYYLNGIQHRQSFRSEKEADPERLLSKRRAEIDADMFVDPAARRLRFDQLRDALYARCVQAIQHRLWTRPKGRRE